MNALEELFACLMLTLRYNLSICSKEVFVVIHMSRQLHLNLLFGLKALFDLTSHGCHLRDAPRILGDQVLVIDGEPLVVFYSPSDILHALVHQLLRCVLWLTLGPNLDVL